MAWKGLKFWEKEEPVVPEPVVQYQKKDRGSWVDIEQPEPGVKCRKVVIDHTGRVSIYEL